MQRLTFSARQTQPLGDELWNPSVQVHAVTADVAASGRTQPGTESFLLVLGGTLDLQAGGGAWLQRGRRADAFDAEEAPVGVFLPPNTPWRATTKDSGDLLILGMRQPEEAQPPTTEEAAARKPLLQMAGSGKAFDSKTQTWKPKEAFLSSPEAILPRRIQVDSGPGQIARSILEPDYKTLGLAVCEAVLLPGGPAWTPTAPSVPGDAGAWPASWLAFVRSRGSFHIAGDACEAGDHACAGSAAELGAFRLEAAADPVYAVFAFGGSKHAI